MHNENSSNSELQQKFNMAKNPNPQMVGELDYDVSNGFCNKVEYNYENQPNTNKVDQEVSHLRHNTMNEDYSQHNTVKTPVNRQSKSMIEKDINQDYTYSPHSNVTKENRSSQMTPTNGPKKIAQYLPNNNNSISGSNLRRDPYSQGVVHSEVITAVNVPTQSKQGLGSPILNSNIQLPQG